jgi:3-isopropylmalate dehydrogenase
LPKRPSLIGVIPGEGIGPEVIDAALRVLSAASQRFGLYLEIRTYEGPIGERALARSGSALPAEAAAYCESIFAAGGALLCGPGGARFVYDLRARFDLFCKLAPIRPWPALRGAGVLRSRAVDDTDLVIVRENCGGLYFGASRSEGLPGGAGERVHHSFSYDSLQVHRILAVAVALAQRRKGRLALVVKPSGVPGISRLWTELFAELVAGAELDTRVLEIDNACYQIIAAAADFDVVVSSNLFGDILADCAALLLGSRGMSYSGNFDTRGAAVYQTGHGAARDLAGRDLANPIGQVLAAAFLLRESFGLHSAADAIEAAVEQVLAAGIRTADIAARGSKIIGTSEMAGRLAESIQQESDSPAVAS